MRLPGSLPALGLGVFCTCVELGPRLFAIACFLAIFFLMARCVSALATTVADPNSNDNGNDNDSDPYEDYDTESTCDLVWIPNNGGAPDTPLAFEQDPFSILCFNVGFHLKAGRAAGDMAEANALSVAASDGGNAVAGVQPVELVFHSSWPTGPHPISLHFSSAGVSAFHGSYVDQFPRDPQEGFSVVQDDGIINLYAASEAEDLDQDEAARSVARRAARRSRLFAIIAITFLVCDMIRTLLRSHHPPGSSTIPEAFQGPGAAFAPQGHESWPLPLWEETWMALEVWADVMDPLMPPPAGGPENASVYAAFNGLPFYYSTISEFGAQLGFIISSTSDDILDDTNFLSPTPRRAAIDSACQEAQERLGVFVDEWDSLLAYSTGPWLKRPLRKLMWAGLNITRSFRSETWDAPEDVVGGNDSPASSDDGGTQSDRKRPRHNYDNSTGLYLLNLANPSLPELHDSSRALLSRLRDLQTYLTTAFGAVDALYSLLPADVLQQVKNHQLDRPDASFIKSWIRFDFESWWAGDERYGAYGFEAMVKSAAEIARLRRVLHAIGPRMEEIVQSSGNLVSSLQRIEAKVTSLADVERCKHLRQSNEHGMDGVWVTLGWRTSCECDGAAGSDTSRRLPENVVVTPVLVEYFVPAADVILDGMNRTYHMLHAKQLSARLRYETGRMEQWQRAGEALDQFTEGVRAMQESGRAAAGEDHGDSDQWPEEPFCMDMPIDNEGHRACLSPGEVKEAIDERLEGYMPPRGWLADLLGNQERQGLD